MLPLVLLLAACGGAPVAPTPDPATPPAPDLVPLAPAEPVDAGPVRVGESPWSGPRSQTVDGPPLVVLMVLDTVRADHTSLCGYDRPTTPWLAGLVKKGKGVSASCDAYAPGTWTVPSHASYFTGLAVPDHGTDASGVGLPAELPTLAEAMAEAGWQTMAVSANPTLAATDGLLRGFDHWAVARTLTGLRGDALAEAVRRGLERVDPERPLFLFVNVLDAHDPWPAIPEGMGWVAPQKGAGLDVHDERQDGPYHRFVRGELAPDAAAAYAARLTDLYDVGVWAADRTANRVMGVLASEGRLERGYRLVLTSDHGEYLGEHGLLRHGCYPFEPVARVPLVVVDTTQVPPVLPSPVSALQVHALVRTGRLQEGVDVASFSRRRVVDPKMGADTVALWPGGGEKLFWFEGRWLRYDLATDPGEMGREGLGEHPARGTLERWVAAHEAHLQDRAEVDAGVVEALRRLGYVE